MEDGINENRRRRPIPIPIYDTGRYTEKPYLMKHEIAKIRDNLDELVEIKTGFVDKPTENKAKIDMPELKKDSKKDDFFIDSIPTTQVPTTTNLIPRVVTKSEIKPTITTPNISLPITDSKVKIEPKIETKSEIKPEFVSEIKPEFVSEIKPEFVSEIKPEFVSKIKKDEIKFGMSNLENKSIQQIDNRKTLNDNKQKNKIIKKKVIRGMNDEETQYITSPEERRRQRKAEIQEFHEEDKTKEAIRKSAELAEQNQRDLAQNRRDLEELRIALAAESDNTKLELKNEVRSKFNELGGKFNEKISDVTGKIDKVTGKLEETCTGIECLKKDLGNMSKNFELTECPDCGQEIVPPLSSFCPGCGAQISGWTEDDEVTPIKGWKPNWKK